MSDPLHILYVDDYALDRALVRDALEQEHGGFRVTEASSQEEFEARLDEDDYDLVLSDFNILGFEGLEVLDAVKERYPHVPVVIVTGTGSEEIAAEALRRGASDYVIKSPDHIRRLPHTIHQVIEKQRLLDERRQAREALQQAYEDALRREEAVLNLAEDLKAEIAERERAERARRESEARFRGAFANAGVGMALVSPAGEFLSVNQAACDVLGYRKREMLDMTFQDITHPDDLDSSIEAYQKLLAGNYDHYEMEKRYVHSRGHVLWGRLNVSLIRDEDGAPLYSIAQLRDVTERKRAQAETRELIFDLQFLSRSATELITLPTEDDIYTYIGENLAHLLEDAIVLVNEDNPTTEEMTIRGIYGLSTRVFERAVDLLPGSPIGQSYPMLPQARALFETGELEIFAGGFVKLGEGYAPMPVLRQLKKLLSINRIYVIGLTQEGELYAGIQIYCRNDTTVDRPDLVETFVRQASIALQRRRAEEALRRTSEERRVLLELVPVGITVTDEEGDIIEANRMSEELLGISVEEHKVRRVTGQEWDIIRPDGSPMPGEEYASVRALREQRIVRNVGMGIRRPDGDVTWISVSAAPIPLEGYGVAIAYADVTARKHAEDALEERASQLALVNTVGGRIASELDLHALFESVPRYVCQSFGYDNVAVLTLDAEQGALTLQGNHGTFSAHVSDDLTLDLDEGLIGWAARHGETVLCNDVDADPRYVVNYPDVVETRSELSVPIRSGGEVLGIIDIQSDDRDAFDQNDVLMVETLADQIATAIDNARLYEAEHAAREQLRDLASYLQRAREEERTRIARELHDQFGQMMSALKMDLSWLRRHLLEDQTLLVRRTDAMAESIDSGIQIVRRVCSELRPGVLDELGLAAAIEWQVDRFHERSDVQVELDLEEPDGRKLSQEVTTAAFRIFQEALTNVARHAEATRIRVQLRFQPDALTLVVEDDGKGILPGDVHARESLGLIGMQERARALGGAVSVEGAPGDGTTVTARLPRDAHR